MGKNPVSSTRWLFCDKNLVRVLQYVYGVLHFSIRDVLDGECSNTLNVEMGFDVTLFSGVTARTPSCRMTTLDLCGVRISKSLLQFSTGFIRSTLHPSAENFFSSCEIRLDFLNLS